MVVGEYYTYVYHTYNGDINVKAVSESTVAQLIRSLARMHKLIFNFGILRTCCMLGLACGRLNQNCNMVGTPPYY